MLGWCIVTLAGARLKASVWFPPLRGMYQRDTCEGHNTKLLDMQQDNLLLLFILSFSRALGWLTLRSPFLSAYFSTALLLQLV